MPPKTKTNAKQQPHHTAPYAFVLMVAIVALLTLALLLVWRELPGGTPKAGAPVGDLKPVPAAPASPEQAACEAAKGKWVECGNPCHGQNAEVCITKCEPQCLCGGIAGWSCPKDQVCTDYEPAAGAPDALGVCRDRPAMPTSPVRDRPAGMICDDLNFLCVYEGVKDSRLTSPFTVDGSGIAFENTINWRLLDGNGKELEKGFVTANAPDIGQAGDFQIRAFILTVPSTPTGTLQVLEYSAKDGSPTHVVNIPVRLPAAVMTTRIYMPPPTVGNDCSAVEQVEISVPRSSLPVETALRTLLAVGPTMSSRRTAIPVGTRLESINVSGGTATAVFSPELENYGGGSCNVQAIRAQIETTLKQFSTVKDVVISVIGKTPAETLQP